MVKMLIPPAVRCVLAGVAAVLLAVILTAVPAAGADYRLNVIVELPAGNPQPFEAAWKTLRDELQSRGYPHYTVVSESGPYRHFVSVMGDYAALETIETFRAGLHEDADDDIRNAMEVLQGHSVSVQSYVSRYDRQLSYVPPQSYSGPYHRLETFSFALEHRDALASAFANLNAAWQEAGVSSAFHIMWHGVGGWVGGSVGEGGGQVTMLTSAPSPAEHAAIEAAVRTATGESYEAFEAALWRTVTSARKRYWLSRPELTLKPETRP